MFIFPKEKKTKIQIKTKNNIFYFEKRARQGLTLLLHISIKGGESGLRSSLDKIVCWFDVFIFFENLNIFTKFRFGYR